MGGKKQCILPIFVRFQLLCAGCLGVLVFPASSCGGCHRQVLQQVFLISAPIQKGSGSWGLTPNGSRVQRDIQAKIFLDVLRNLSHLKSHKTYFSLFSLQIQFKFFLMLASLRPPETSKADLIFAHPHHPKTLTSKQITMELMPLWVPPWSVSIPLISGKQNLYSHNGRPAIIHRSLSVHPPTSPPAKRTQGHSSENKPSNPSQPQLLSSTYLPKASRNDNTK